MAKALQSLLVLTGLLCLALGYEPGFQFTYNYHGRSAVGMNELKEQTAIVELHGKVIVQSTDEKTLYVKLNEWRLKRNGRWLKSPYFVYGEDSTPEEIEGVEESLTNQELLSTPFVIFHKKGSIVSVKIGSEEPHWIANFKKSIASQLQLDITGVRADGVKYDVPTEDLNSAVTTFEDGVTGDCSTVIQINRLPIHQAIQSDAFDFAAWETVCKDVPVWEIVKTKDFNRCINNPVFHSVAPPSYLCTLGRGQCGDAMQRTSTYKYIGCGPSFDKLNLVHITGFGDFIARPFGIKTEKINANSLTSWVLEKKESISGMMAAPANPTEWSSLAYVFSEIEAADGTNKYPDLTNAWMRSPVPTSTFMNNIQETFRIVAKDLLEKPDADKDNMERLATVARFMRYLSLEELRSLWEQVKGMDEIYLDLFVDTVVQSGTNPAIMLIKKLIENEEIKGTRAIWAIGAMGYYTKTPTRELMQELINMIKSRPVQDSKMMKQTAFLTVADLLNAACHSPFFREKRFPVEYLGDFCSSKDTIIIDDFLPMLAEELKSTESTSTADHLAALTAIGSLGIEEILPILEPHIKGTGKFDDTAERTRAILSTHRVMYNYPERVLPWLMPLADNVAERPEVRMAAISMILTANSPFVYWQRLASRTWFEPSIQVQSFIYNMLYSYSKFTPTSPYHMEIVTKARSALDLARPTPFGLPYSWSFMRSSYLPEGLGVLQHTPMWRVADEKWPVAFSNRWLYQFGLFSANPLEVYVWNYNMDEFWTTLFSRLTGSTLDKKVTVDVLKQIWDEIKPTRRPADKPTGFIHVKLMNSISRVFDVLKMEKDIPKWMTELMSYQAKPLPVSFLKYRMLAEVNMRIPTDMGLPLRFLVTVPLLTSWQGEVTADFNAGSFHWNVASEFNWKLTTEVRVELPWSGNYIASGVDVRNDIRFPRESVFKFSSMYRMFNWTWIPSDKTVDMIYYHVKPYTITRNLLDNIVPTLEDKSVHIISVKETPFERDLPLTEGYGVDVRLLTRSEMDHFDTASWMQWWQKFDANSFSNVAFVPLTLRHRQYHVRYQPEGTTTKSFEAFMHYDYHWKHSERSTVIETGTGKAINSAELKSRTSFSEVSKHVAERLFKEVDGGRAEVFVAGFKSQMADGSFYLFNASLGSCYDDMNTKEYRDVRFERSFFDASHTRKVNFAVCGVTTRNWNAPPAFGFSPDVLYMTEDSRYWFSTSSCDAPEGKMTLKAKVYRNETAATFARESPAGRRCQEQMTNGFVDSPACYEAREMDQTYNVYEVSTEFDNFPIFGSWYWQRAKYMFNNMIAPFVVDHRVEANNPTNRFIFTVKRHPMTGDSDMTVVRPGETIEARNVRGTYLRFSPLLSNYMKAFYPLKAGRNFAQVAVDMTLANVTEAKCYVGPRTVFTFDGPAYNYTFDGCNHVLITDSWKSNNFAVLAREVADRKIVTVIYEKDVIEVDPTGFVTINGVKKPLSGRIQIVDGKKLIADIYPVTNGVKFYLHSVYFFMKIQGKHITMNAPLTMRGRTAGLCGDYNQEIVGEWRTADRCALSTGELMAASFRLSTGEGCSALSGKLSEDLNRETKMCYSVDEMVRSWLPSIDLKQPTKCTRYEPLTMNMGENMGATCTSTTSTVLCSAGCKPSFKVSKSFTFKCTGGEFDDFHTQLLVPAACTTY